MNYLYVKFKDILFQCDITIKVFQHYNNIGYPVYRLYNIKFAEYLSPNIKTQTFNYTSKASNSNQSDVFNILKITDGVNFKFKISNLPNRSLVSVHIKDKDLSYNNLEVTMDDYILTWKILSFRYLTLQVRDDITNKCYPFLINTFPINLNISALISKYIQIPDCIGCIDETG